MAKKKEEALSFEETMDALNKKYGEGSVMTLNARQPKNTYNVISTGSIGFDYKVLGVGGFVKGKLYELMGWEGCLSEDTYIKFINVRPDGIVQDCKGSSIKNLYKRFHNRTEKTKETVFHVTSINEKNRVFRNQILDVVKTGEKECFLIKTEKGFELEATKDHKFFTGNDYVSLEDLKINGTLFVHNNTPYSVKNPSNKNKYKETTIKKYYKGETLIEGYTFFREKVHRLVYEASLNMMTYDQYKQLLNSYKPEEEFPKHIITIPEGCDVHHIDENTHNNELENLELISSEEHCRLHALERHNNLRFQVMPDKITSISSIGIKPTYDIKCAFPYNNFIAQGIVVHNSGKSTICGHLTAECQKKGGKVVYIDGEHAVDKNYFKSLGVDTNKMIISQPSNGEQGFQIAMEMINSGEVDLVIIDSDSSLIPKKVIDGDIGDSAIGRKALLNSNAYPKLKNKLVEKDVCVVVISQYREKIGVMFGNPTTTQGGHALKFYSDCRVEIARSLKKEGDDVIANKTRVKTVKNKTSPPFKKCEFNIWYGVGIDKVEELMDLAKDLGLGKKYGQTYTFHLGTPEEKKYGLAEFKEMLQSDTKFFNSLKKSVVKALLEEDKELKDE